MIWRVELLNGTDKLCHESELKPMPEKKEKCKHKRILHLGNMSNNTDYWNCVDCGKKVEKQSEPKGFKEEKQMHIHQWEFNIQPGNFWISYPTAIRYCKCGEIQSKYLSHEEKEDWVNSEEIS